MTEYVGLVDESDHSLGACEKLQAGTDRGVWRVTGAANDDWEAIADGPGANIDQRADTTSRVRHASTLVISATTLYAGLHLRARLRNARTTTCVVMAPSSPNPARIASCLARASSSVSRAPPCANTLTFDNRNRTLLSNA